MVVYAVVTVIGVACWIAAFVMYKYKKASQSQTMNLSKVCPMCGSRVSAPQCEDCGERLVAKS